MVSRACFPDLHAHTTVGNFLNQAHKVLVPGSLQGPGLLGKQMSPPQQPPLTPTPHLQHEEVRILLNLQKQTPTESGICTHVCTKSLQSCPTLRDPMDCSPPASSVHGILQARILQWVTMPFSRGSSRSRDRTCASCNCFIVGGLFTAEPLRMPLAYSVHSIKWQV